MGKRKKRITLGQIGAALRNRLPGGVVFKSLAESYRLYRNDRAVDFYKIQFLHNIKAYCVPTRRFCPIQYAVPIRPVPPLLFHITDKKNAASILQDGLVAKANPAVFLTVSEEYIDFLKDDYSPDGCVLFKIHSAQMEQDGFCFFNDRQKDRDIIWITHTVPPQYLETIDLSALDEEREATKA